MIGKSDDRELKISRTDSELCLVCLLHVQEIDQKQDRHDPPNNSIRSPSAPDLAYRHHIARLVILEIQVLVYEMFPWQPSLRK